jgi:hypothetical protein
VNSDDPNAELIQWKRKMALMRRKNLREGLLELHERKRRTDWVMAKRSAEKQAKRERILQQPQRDDERLTSPTIVQAMQPTRSAVLPDPDREERLAQSRLRVQTKEAEKTAARQDSLHSLYMNARNFITTEAQLAAEIERVFPEGENEAWRNDHQAGDNIWNLGLPPTIQSIVMDAKKSEAARWEVMQGRVKKLAEEITGGKMD